MYWNSYGREEKKKDFVFFAINRKVDISTETEILDQATTYNIWDLCNRTRTELIFVCSTDEANQYIETDIGKEWMSKRLAKYFTCAIVAHSTEEKKARIREYLNDHEHEEYVILDHTELEPWFLGHTIYLPKEDELDKLLLQRAKRILKYGACGLKRSEEESWRGDGKLIEDDFRKAIFLDIDGVLNDDGKRVRAGEQICPDFVENLAWIVEQTSAEIILSSSWRYGIGPCIYEDSTEGDRSVQRLLEEFAKHHLRIAGMTPRYFNGPDGRPFEVRSWLAPRPDLESFVILDDEDFWKWNWMADRVVCTAKSLDLWDYEKGLNREYAGRAAEILNRVNHNEEV